MALSGSVLSQDYLARADQPPLSVACSNFNRSLKIDDVLASGRVVPLQIVASVGYPKSHARDRYGIGDLAGGATAGPLDVKIANMRLTICVRVDVVNSQIDSVLAGVTQLKVSGTSRLVRRRQTSKADISVRGILRPAT